MSLQKLKKVVNESTKWASREDFSDDESDEDDFGFYSETNDYFGDRRRDRGEEPLVKLES
eukprot:4128519-Pyramimonas_sp.AAC.1